MTATATGRTSKRRVRFVAATGATALALTVLTTLAGVPGAQAVVRPAVRTSTKASTDPATTTVRVSSFNVLGYSHTAKGGDRKNWAGGDQRMVWATQIMAQYDLQIIGLQEFQVPQYKKFVSLAGSTYDVWPGTALGGVPVQNSIAWKKATWTPIVEKTIPIPYFDGKPIDMPYILLQNNNTGQQVWIYNSHNPADTAGPAQKYRNEAVAKESALINSLEKQYPGTPVIDLGDKNDRGPYLCPMMEDTNLRAANGGSIDGTTCTLPHPMVVDWITGSPAVTFAGYQSLQTPLIKKTTDHHVVFADATLTNPAATASAVKHVVAINIQGLRGPALASTSKSPMPNLHRMMTYGASTTEARPDDETVHSTQNVVSMLTSRATAKKYGGTGLAADPRGTVHQAAGSYVSSVFDVVHNAGLRTGFWTSNASLARTVTTSWNKTNGGVDRVGTNNGRAKISTSGQTVTDKAAMNALIADLKAHHSAFDFADLTAADRIARTKGTGAASYKKALTTIDGYLGKLLRAISSTPALAGHTTVIVTSDHGAALASFLKPTEMVAYRVPFVVWGAGVSPGTDLYALNPSFTDPGTARVSYSAAAQPIRVSYLANLTTRLLGLPRVPSSSMDSARKLRVDTGD
jgi:hypothetical protein